jgi:hypothetical protein
LPASVTFTPANWNAAQEITVAGANDFLDDGDIAYTIVTAAAASSDANYNGLNADDVAATNTDNDTAGITVTPTSGLTTTEAGGTAQFSVRLNAQPTSNVTIPLSADASEGALSAASVTFSPINWSIAQEITITGVNDFLDDADAAYSVVTEPAVSSDPVYSGLNALDVTATNTDDDMAGYTVTENGGGTQVNENGASDTFSVVLTAQPIGDVFFVLTASDATEATVSPATLTFTPANWNVPQTTTVTGVDDLLLDGAQASDITIALDQASSDPPFAGLADQTVNVTTADDDALGPTDLSPATIPEDVDTGAADVLVGALSTGDLNAGNPLVYSLVSGASDEDNSRFVVSGNQLLLKMGTPIDFETQASLNVRIRVSHGAEMFDTMLVVSVLDVNEAPTDIALANATVDENDAGASVGDVTAADPDAGDSHTLEVSDDRFEIVAGALKLKDGVSLDFETQASINLQITATDSEGRQRTEEFIVTVTDVFEAPPHPWRNSRLRWDVDDNGSVQINDLLLLVRALREDGIDHPLPLEYTPPGGPPPYLDVDGNDRCSLNDLLDVVRYLRENPIAPLGGEEEEEHEDGWFDFLADDVARSRARSTPEQHSRGWPTRGG